jgi:hypothetical protein
MYYVGGQFKENDLGLSMWIAWAEVLLCAGFWWGNLKEIHHFEYLGIGGRTM